MKKRMITVMLALAALASCSKKEVPPSAPEPIAVKAVYWISNTGYTSSRPTWNVQITLDKVLNENVTIQTDFTDFPANKPVTVIVPINKGHMYSSMNSQAPPASINSTAINIKLSIKGNGKYLLSY